MIRFPHKLDLCVQYANTIIVRGVPFLLPAGKMIGTAQLAGKKWKPISKQEYNKTIQVSTFSKMFALREVLFNKTRLMDLKICDSRITHEL